MITISLFDNTDWPEVWAILKPVFRAGETYAYAPDIHEDAARNVWITAPKQTFVARNGSEILGTYYLKANQPGLGDHVCNCGYVVAASARGQGIAGKMCNHSQVAARNAGFHAMQYNLVAASNTGAVRLWQKMDFEIIGTLPQAFRHAKLGLTDAHVMYKILAE